MYCGWGTAGRAGLGLVKSVGRNPDMVDILLLFESTEWVSSTLSLWDNERSCVHQSSSCLSKATAAFARSAGDNLNLTWGYGRYSSTRPSVGIWTTLFVRHFFVHATNTNHRSIGIRNSKTPIPYTTIQ
jgi:hypothetical protein